MISLVILVRLPVLGEIGNKTWPIFKDAQRGPVSPIVRRLRRKKNFGALLKKQELSIEYENFHYIRDNPFSNPLSPKNVRFVPGNWRVTRADFNEELLYAAILDYQKRKVRDQVGGVGNDG
ncbi:hypothetical protein [Paenibacillus cymbidii]|uniref:hypothetical protein n=1 Tax=Paenibacillus cymbidii TaxID=1639034 RepID=UPI001081F8F9|nr:hypothetical protein [Paenibacillus cymbidii]